MFRKILLGSVAALGLMSTAVAPIDAHPVAHAHYVHPAYRHVPHGPYTHRVFGCWADANGWILSQRTLGFDCYFEWHGPQCWVFYR
jgi:hypothetical protein